jgi:hypothetical protein
MDHTGFGIDLDLPSNPGGPRTKGQRPLEDSVSYHRLPSSTSEQGFYWRKTAVLMILVPTVEVSCVPEGHLVQRGAMKEIRVITCFFLLRKFLVRFPHPVYLFKKLFSSYKAMSIFL